MYLFKDIFRRRTIRFENNNLHSTTRERFPTSSDIERVHGLRTDYNLQFHFDDVGICNKRLIYSYR